MKVFQVTLLATIVTSVFMAATAYAVVIETVPVGNLGNLPDADNGWGAVNYAYSIGKTEVTISQYSEFLNAVDPTGVDTLDLWNGTSGLKNKIPLTPTAADGSKYGVKPGKEHFPVTFVDWYDTIRFANWLHNGQGSGDTETGAYTLLGGTPNPTDGNLIERNPGAQWFVASEDEWYKAAHHKNDGDTANYWQYPTASDTLPTAEDAPGGTNSANYGAALNALRAVGSYVDSLSPYGTYDQGGNTNELTDTISTSGNTFRVLRGGSAWLSSTFVHKNTWTNPSSHSLGGGGERAEGFRVATIPVPEPGLGVLLALGTVCLLLVRRTFSR